MRYLALNVDGILVVGSFAIIVLWLIADVRIPDGTKGPAFYIIVLVAGAMMIAGGLVM